MKDLDEPIPSENVKVVILKPEILGGSVGITLAGGTDYETKEISVSVQCTDDEWKAIVECIDIYIYLEPMHSIFYINSNWAI